MKTFTRQGISGLWIYGFAALAVLALLGSTACGSGKAASPPTEDMLSLAVLTPIFGEAKDVNSGLADFTQSDNEVILAYHLYLADRTNADQEIARDLGPKIRKLYGHFKNVDRVAFGIYLPDPSATLAWEPYVSFVMTRKLVKETGWSDLLDTKLLSIALDVKRTD